MGAENQVKTLESQQTEILQKYSKLQTVFQKQKNQLVETLQQRVDLEEKVASLSDKYNELDETLQTKTQLYSNLQLRFQQKKDECNIITTETNELKEKLRLLQNTGKQTEQSIQEAQNEAILRISELERELEDRQRSFDEMNDAARKKEAL